MLVVFSFNKSQREYIESNLYWIICFNPEIFYISVSVYFLTTSIFTVHWKLLNCRILWFQLPLVSYLKLTKINALPPGEDLNVISFNLWKYSSPCAYGNVSFAIILKNIDYGDDFMNLCVRNIIYQVSSPENFYLQMMVCSITLLRLCWLIMML